MAQVNGGIESVEGRGHASNDGKEVSPASKSRLVISRLEIIHKEGTPNNEEVTIERDGIKYTGLRVNHMDGPVYVGYSKSEPEGIVILVWQDGSTYECKCVEGQPNGRGVYTWPDRTQFYSLVRKEGDTMAIGKLNYRNGNCWDCEAAFSDGLDALSLVNEKYGCTVKFPQGLPHGEVTYIDRSVWSVEFTHGLTEGKLKYLDGTKYEGKLEGFQPSGSGVYRWQDGTEYSGNWILGRIEGDGMMIWPDKAIYQGQWVDGKKQGIGTYTWPDQLKYEGQWHGDKRLGEGIYLEADGKKTHVKWVDGRPFQIRQYIHPPVMK